MKYLGVSAIGNCLRLALKNELLIRYSSTLKNGNNETGKKEQNTFPTSVKGGGILQGLVYGLYTPKIAVN